MKQTEPDQPALTDLLRENEALKRQIQQLKSAGNGASSAASSHEIWRPSATTIWAIFLGAAVLVVIAFISGYMPLVKRREVIAGEAREQERALPRVEVVEVQRSSGQAALELPGSIQAITEAPILARADGYLQRRTVDIGDRVQAGRTLAEIDAPELDEQ